MSGFAIMLAAAAAALTTPLTPTCLRVVHAVPVDAVPSPADFERANCPSRPAEPSFRYDSAQGISRTLRPLQAGETVRTFPEYSAGTLRPGDKIRLVSVAGAVRISREVEALQAAAPGQQLFVRTCDGEILSAKYEARR